MMRDRLLEDTFRTTVSLFLLPRIAFWILSCTTFSSYIPTSSPEAFEKTTQSLRGFQEGLRIYFLSAYAVLTCLLPLGRYPLE
jgi:hypothetical protein